MGVSPPVSTTVSLRILMAEAEEEEKRHGLGNDSLVKTLSVQRTITRGVNNRCVYRYTLASCPGSLRWWRKKPGFNCLHTCNTWSLKGVSVCSTQ